MEVDAEGLQPVNGCEWGGRTSSEIRGGSVDVDGCDCQHMCRTEVADRCLRFVHMPLVYSRSSAELGAVFCVY